MRALLFAAAIATVTLASLSSTASATSPLPTTIAGTVTQFGPPPDFQGTWQSAGGISDSGSFVETEFHLPQAFDHSPVAVIFQTVSVFSGATEHSPSRSSRSPRASRRAPGKCNRERARMSVSAGTARSRSAPRTASPSRG